MGIAGKFDLDHVLACETPRRREGKKEAGHANLTTSD
jgi:hypothetical protein